MADFNLEAKTPQEVRLVIVQIESKAREQIISNPDKALTYLDSCLSEASENKDLRNQISKLKTEIQQEIAINAARASGFSAPVKNDPRSNQQGGGSSQSDKAKVAEIGILQKTANEFLAAIKNDPKTEIFDEKGEKLTDEKSKISKSNIIHVADTKEEKVQGFIGCVSDIYNKFKSLGFAVHHKEHESEEAHHFAIALPKNYQGNKNILEMNQDHIEDLLQMMRSEIKHEMEVISHVIGSLEKQALLQFNRVQNEELVKNVVSSIEGVNYLFEGNSEKKHPKANPKPIGVSKFNLDPLHKAEDHSHE